MNTRFRLLLIILFLLPAFQTLSAQSTAIVYKGYITDMYGKPLTGSYDLTFKLFNETKGDMEIWTETHPAVAVDKGLMQLSLGKFKSGIRGHFVSNDQLYFKIAMSGMDFEHKIKLPERARQDALSTGVYSQGMAGRVGNPSTPVATPNKPATSATPSSNPTVNGGKWICPDVAIGKGAKQEYASVSIVNMGLPAVKVWLTFYNASGKEVRSVAVDIPGMGSTTRKFRDADLPPDVAWAELATNGAPLYPAGFRKKKDDHPDGSATYLAIPLTWYSTR